MTKGQRIKQLRESQNLSQTELSQKANIRKQTLYKYENEIVTNIPSDVIEKFATILGCSASYIMGWEETQTEKDELQKAMELYQKYKSAIPQVQDAVDTLLKSTQSES